MDIAHYNAHACMHIHGSELLVTKFMIRVKMQTSQERTSHMKRRYLGGITLVSFGWSKPVQHNGQDSSELLISLAEWLSPQQLKT